MKNQKFNLKKSCYKSVSEIGREVNDEKQGMKFYFGENLNWKQVRNSYVGIDTSFWKTAKTNFVVADDNTKEKTRLVIVEFAYTIHDASISTSSKTEIEQNEFAGPVSRNMRFLTLKDGDVSTYFDMTDENANGINISSLKQILYNHHTEARRKKTRGPLPLKFINGFCRLFNKRTKTLGPALNWKHETGN